MDHSSRSRAHPQGIALALIVLFFMFPIVWIFLMSFQTNETILRIPPSLFFSPTLSNYKALISGKLQTAAGTLDIPFMHNLWNSVLLSTRFGDRRADPRRAGRLCVRPLQVPRQGGHRLHAAVVPLRAAAARAAAAVALLPGDPPQRHLYRADLGLSADRAAADPLDRARLFRGHQPRHRERLPGRRPQLVADVHPRSPSRWPGRASRRRGCCPSSSAGTTSSSRWCSPRPTSSR